MDRRPLALSQSDPRVRPRRHTFCPPLTRLWAVRLAQCLAPWVIRRKLKVVRIRLSEDDYEKLCRLKGRRCLLLPSHSGGFEPYLVVRLSRRLRDSYNYLAAMEAFQRNPLVGWFMQRMGAYSIIRGTADRPSFQMTRRLLVEGRRWLVVFPEGQTVWQNDTVLPFQEGVIQLAFKAYEDALRADPAASLFCVPMAIKYTFLRDMGREIEASLGRLEAGLFDQGTALAGGSPYERLRRIGEAVLTANEKRHGVNVRREAPLDQRIQTMKERIVRGVEDVLGLTPRSDQSLLDRVRMCFNEVDRINGEEAAGSEYERGLMNERRTAAGDLYADLWRVLQFVAIYDGYVRESQTQERFMDVLCLLEMEVFGQRRIWGPRQALIKVGEPLDLRERLSAYRENKRGAVRDVTRELESSVRGMLEALGRAGAG